MVSIGRIGARVLVSCALVGGLAACGTGEAASSSEIDWYVVPGRTDAASLADTCSRLSGGEYRVRLHELPTDIDDRHTDLVRRLSGANDTVDVLSLDTSLVAEMSGAGFLAPLSAAQQAAWGEGVAPGALEAASPDGELVAAPWWFDPQLLWFRGIAAERAGLDTSAPILWDDLVAGADRLGLSIQVEDVDGTGVSEWVAGLTAGAGGQVVDGDDARLDSDAARSAASVIEFYRESQVGPGPSSDALPTFAGAGGGFLLASSSALSSASLQVVAPELGFTQYPVVSGDTGVPPAAGMTLAVARDSDQKAEAAALVSCLTAPEQQRSLVLASGHGAARLATYDDPAVQRDSPTAEVVAEALATARSVPASTSWNAVRRVIDATWSPIDSVTADSTPTESQREAQAAIDGDLP